VSLAQRCRRCGCAAYERERWYAGARRALAPLAEALVAVRPTAAVAAAPTSSWRRDAVETLGTEGVAM
jgi:hypothetical protein